MASLKRVNTFLPDFFDQKGFFHTIGPVVVNVAETTGTFLLDMLIPGFRKEDFSLRVEDGLLRVTAQRGLPKLEEDTPMEAGYERTVNLPPNADENAIGAKVEEGLLRITVGKKQSVFQGGIRSIGIE